MRFDHDNKEQVHNVDAHVCGYPLSRHYMIHLYFN